MLTYRVPMALMLAAVIPACSDATALDMPLRVASTVEALHDTPPAVLIAKGSIAGDGCDLAEQTAGPLENGVSGNILGGIGSGLAHAGGTTFLALPDRGPNAVEYNAAVDETTSYIPRFHTLDLTLRRSPKHAELPFELDVELGATTLLYSTEPLVYGDGSAAELPDGAPELNDEERFYFSGRSDNFDAERASTDAHNGRFDPESIRISNDGQCVFVSDEYGPYVYEFDRATGERKRTFTLPGAFAVETLSAQGDVEIEDNSAGRVANKGMEALAITPDGSALIGAMQSPLLQDEGTDGRFVRFIRLPLAGGPSTQFAYALSNIGTEEKPKYPTISDIVAINDHEFLVDERDGKGLGDDSEAVFKRIYHIDASAASDVSEVEGEDALAEHAVDKTLVLDVVAELNAHGIASSEIPAKLEGLAFGRDVRTEYGRRHTLFLATDNDFLPRLTDETHPDGVDNPNQFFVFAIDPRALPGYEPQQLRGRGRGGLGVETDEAEDAPQ